jgi:hypothetical protein
VKNPRQTNELKAQNLNESEKDNRFSTEFGVYRSQKLKGKSQNYNSKLKEGAPKFKNQKF